MVTIPVLTWLGGLGLAPADLTYLGLARLHVDHAGTANLFATSTVLIGAREHQYAFSDLVVGDYYPDDHAALRAGLTILVDGEHDVFGDGTVVIHPAPGHTPGHQVLAVAFPGKEILILVGDVYYTEADRTHRRIPSWNLDREQSFRSMDRVAQLAAATGASS